jgi:putative oxidoreductase
MEQVVRPALPVQPVRRADAIFVRVLSFALAALFLVTGLAKILGFVPAGMHAASMIDSPSWVRIIVGVIEVICAIALVPRATATVAAFALAGMMMLATAIQYASHEGLIWVPPLVALALVIVAWRRNTDYVRTGYVEFMGHSHPLLRDAVLSGAVGAAVIAVWFFIIDAVSGQPLRTPTVLGRGLFTIFGPVAPDEGTFLFVLSYTAFHFVAFMFVGFIAALVVHTARREPSILLGFIMLFAAMEVGIFVLVSIFDLGTPLGRYAWLQIMAANLLAALSMGWYFWYTHKELAEEFRHSLDWETYDEEARHARENAESRPAAPVLPTPEPGPPEVRPR